MRSVNILAIFAMLTFCCAFNTFAASVTIPSTFNSGTTARASEVNANFSAIKTAVDDNDSRIVALESALAALQTTVSNQALTIAGLTDTVSTLQSRIEALEGSNVMALDDYVSVDAVSDDRGPLVQLSGINLQIVNGLGSTGSVNGLGNLIVGYDEITEETTRYCSDGAYINQSTCEAAGESWAASFKTGSHYLVLGAQNNYSRYGGLVTGFKSYARGDYSNVTGGYLNNASGRYSSISGGELNKSSGYASSVSGGSANTSSASYSSVSGGSSSDADGYASSISGGEFNTASGGYSSVSGGVYNSATGPISSVSGGDGNQASGRISSVSGGYNRSASGDHDWAAGALFQDN